MRAVCEEGMKAEGATRGETLRSGLTAVAATAVGALAIASHEAVARRFYGGLAIPQGVGMTHLLPDEIVALALFAVFGGVAGVAFAIAFHESGLAARLLEWSHAVAGREPLLAALTAAAVLVMSLGLGQRVLGGAAITDDEHAYRFIAATLAEGRLTAPSPGTDLAFFKEQFIVLTPRARYGKYPIGHPLLLAAGRLAGLEPLVVPLLTALLVVGVFLVGREVGGPATAALAAVLCAISPQVLLTGGTALSQPASGLSIVMAVWALLRARRAPRRRAWLLAAGAALGFAVLTRPLPAVLFVVALAGHTWWEAREAAMGERIARVATLLVPMAAAALVLLAVNDAQTGEALTSGYQTFHGTSRGVAGVVEFLRGDLADLAMSLSSGLVRLNFWLFGWPLSFLLLPFARRGGPPSLLWMVVVAEIAYRLISPKAGVAGTGPVYFYEAIPMLAVLSADGAHELATRALVVGTRRFAALATAAAMAGFSVTAIVLFVPARLRDLARMGAAQRVAPDLVRQESAGRPALVFHEGTVPPWTRLSWAYFPPVNPPSLQGPVLYVRAVRSPTGDLAPSVDFWRRRYPERAAWFFVWPPGEPPALVDLETHARRMLRSDGPPAP